MRVGLENYYNVSAWRRRAGCACPGCRLWQAIRAGLRSFNAPLARCLYATPIWEVSVPNLVTTQGKNGLLTQYFKGVGYTASWNVGLVDSVGFVAYAAADTAAGIGGTNGWTESVIYSNATREAWVGGAASDGVISNTGSVAVFLINAAGTIRGAFFASDSAKGGTGGILYGEADFTAARDVADGNAINVRATLVAS